MKIPVALFFALGFLSVVAKDKKKTKKNFIVYQPDEMRVRAARTEGAPRG